MQYFFDALKNEFDKTTTTNGAVVFKTTGQPIMDMFSLGGAYRNRSEEDCILLFKSALEENETYAMKCLFYLRDIRGGQGERRFFRVCYRWLANTCPEIARRNMKHLIEFGRVDDLYCLDGTKLENEMYTHLRKLFRTAVEQMRDETSNTMLPYTVFKWLCSCNASSSQTRYLGQKTRKALGYTEKQYRKILSWGREKERVLERLMSDRRFDEIDFSHIPSKAGLMYRKSFQKHDIDRQAAGKETYAEFAKSDKEVNAEAMYPYEVVGATRKYFDSHEYSYSGFNYWWEGGKFPKSLNDSLNDTERLMLNKYWKNQKNYINEKLMNALCVVDTSGSMFGNGAMSPINVAVSLGLYCAERCSGPFKNHFMTFNSEPEFVEIKGVDFVDKVYRMFQADWGSSTNIEAVFDMMLKIVRQNNIKQRDIPELIIITDMQFNASVRHGYDDYFYPNNQDLLFKKIEEKWNFYGYDLPKLTFWNVNASKDTFPIKDTKYVTYVSGASPSTYEALLTGKSGFDLMIEVLDRERYACIH